jgi:hypothetical protein
MRPIPLVWVSLCNPITTSVCQDSHHLSLNLVNFLFLKRAESLPGACLSSPGLMMSFLQQAAGVVRQEKGSYPAGSQGMIKWVSSANGS